MFDSITLTGGEGTIVWGYHTAAVCRVWTITKTAAGTWTLSAAIARADPFQLRQTPLNFTAPRKGGFFCWPIVSVALEASRLAATLGQPEH